jgi:chromosome segregation ATPase
MGFFKKLKKLLFRKKRKERLQKGDTSKGIVEDNPKQQEIEEDQKELIVHVEVHNVQDVVEVKENDSRQKQLEGTIRALEGELVEKARRLEEKECQQKELEETINALQRTLNENTRIIEEKEDRQQQMEGTICGLKRMVEEQQIERDQVEAQLHARIKELQEEMDKRESKSAGVEAILHRHAAEVEVKLDRKKRELRDCEQVEDALRGQVKEQKKKILEMDRVASTLRDEVYELRQNLEERHCSRDRVESILCRRVTELEMELEEKEYELGDCAKVEKALREQIKSLKMHIKFDSDSGKVEDAAQEDTYKQTGDEETVCLQVNDCAPDAATGPPEGMRHIFNHFLYSSDIWFFVFMVSIFWGHICAFINYFY